MCNVVVAVSRASALAALVLLSAQAKAKAQDAETIADVRCVIVGFNFAAMKDSQHQIAGAMMSLYYVGRLNGRAPKLDLESLLIKEVEVMTPSDYELEAKRCGASLSNKGQEISQIGKDLAAREPSKPAK
jgi:hypothetical protein